MTISNSAIKDLKDKLNTVVRYCITKSPGFASIALWIPYHIYLEDFDLIACTDGKSIRVGQRFFDYQPAEQAFIVIHEVMHVALRHVQRSRIKDCNPLLWNIATDAVINQALRHVGWLSCPADAIILEKLIDEETLKLHSAYQWTSEQVYYYLLKHPDRCTATLFMADLRTRSVAVEASLGEFGDGTDNPSHSREIQDRIWRSRLVRAQAGDRAGGIFRHLQQDFPTSKTPWQHYLRQYLTQAMLPQRETNWSKPSRRSVSLLDLDIEIFEPATRPKPGLKRAGIVIDTSGSIDDELLHKFVAEVQSIQTRTGCEVYLISADADVQTEDLIRSHEQSLVQLIKRKQIELKGGGGTDFRPALECLKSKSISVCVYLTDLMGTFPDRAPNYDLIWASTSPDLSAPFGKVIILE